MTPKTLRWLAFVLGAIAVLAMVAMLVGCMVPVLTQP
jgi:hypothetical protein